METTTVFCPHCEGCVSVPLAAVGRRARCPYCRKVFVIKRPHDMLADSVVNWLRQDDEEQEDELLQSSASGPSVGHAQPRDKVALEAVAEPTAGCEGSTLMGQVVEMDDAGKPPPQPDRGEPQDQPSSPAPPAKPKRKVLTRKPMAPPPPPAARDRSHRYSLGGIGMPLSLVHIGVMGATFEFPETLLEVEKFRASMPICCASCGSKDNLYLRQVLFEEKIPYWAKNRAEQIEQATIRSLSDCGGREGGELVRFLQLVPHMPAPFNLPFPYFLCENCLDSRELLTRIVDRHGVESCELLICNLAYAAEFVARLGGADSEAHKALLAADRQRRQHPWQSLPAPVQQRIAQWYHPLPGEQFMGYLKDDDMLNDEPGNAGIIVTDQRILYRRLAEPQEFAVGEELGLTGRAAMLVEWPLKAQAPDLLDRGTVAQIRQLLANIGRCFGLVC